MQQRLIHDVQNYLQSLSEDQRIEAINAFRQAIHELSPFREQPVDCVLWIKQDAITANDYNPNNVAPPEKKLLCKSLELDGFTQPIVVTENDPHHYEIVDGFHRHEIGTQRAALKRQLKGYLPVTCLRKERKDKIDRMAATIRHNRARGRHQINAMSEIVRELVLLGWDETKIGTELGMDSDEVLRLKQINGLLELFADRRFSEAWTVKYSERIQTLCRG
ncbi:ParB-like nuclease domain-containing protein [Lelliottia amnigena]|uniref:IbrB-like domain-containing protein n=2 Tax=Lelliottia amnigena TaxID=61646 RepID=UPI00192B7777|nr:ParB/RepB/Spo0J family partition protein [Lelliottia amnigena]MBL5966167.1 ParB-like nuclease domain-containing protein [Lelliottia amnigena]